MTLQDAIVQRITEHDMQRPRSTQVQVGPSDLGDPCDHCLAAKLAGWQKRAELAWLPYIGTAVHAQLERAFRPAPDWLTEQPCTVGLVGGLEVTGTADLFHVPSATVVDFKVVGKSTLDAARRGNVSEKYRHQVHLYGKGLGADTVAIAFLPRNDVSLDRMVWWEEPYDAVNAASTLARADGLHEFVRIGDPIDMLDRAPGCYDCPRYHDWDDYTQTLERTTVPSILSTIMEK